jgi:hypothetical protein
VRVTRPATIRAELFAGKRRVATARVQVEPGHTRTIVVRRPRHADGRYRLVLHAQTLDAPARRLTLRSPVFRVRG